MKTIAKKITAKDVAEYAGVSRSLVSMYLTGNSKVWLSEETKKRIDEGIKELKYTPNTFARALRKGKTKTLGLVMGGISNRFSGCFGEAIMDEVEKRGYRLFIALTKFDIERERMALINMLNYQIDGIIYTLSTSYNREFFQQFESSSCPIVLTENIPDMDFNCVCYGYEPAIADALLHFNRRGQHKTACLVDPFDHKMLEGAVETAKKLAMPLDVVAWQKNTGNNSEIEKQLREKQYDSVISLVADANELFTGDYRPPMIIRYTAPLDPLQNAVGTIYHPFRQWVETIVTTLINTVEHPGAPCRTINVPCEFMTREQTETLRAHQIDDPYYQIFT